MRKRDSQRGAVSVEFLAAVPALLLVVFGGVMLARAVHARARLVDAVSYAARAEAIAASRRNSAVDGAAIQRLVNDRMKSVPECAQPLQVQFQTLAIVPYRRLEVTATCRLSAFSVPGVPSLGVTEVSATAAMPLDVEVN